jgi:hypothetical protein
VIVGVTGVVLPPPPPPQAVSRREIERARSVDRLNSAAGTAFTAGRDTDIQSPPEHPISVSHFALTPTHPFLGYNLRIMLKRLAILAIAVFVAVGVPGQSNKATDHKEQPAAESQPAVLPANSPNEPNGRQTDQTKPDAGPPKWYAALERPDWWIVGAAFATLGLIGWQSYETRRSVDVGTRTLVSTFRPKVIVRSLTLHPKSTEDHTAMAGEANPDGPPWKIRLLIENGGGTAAHIQAADVEIAWLRRSPDHKEPIQTEKRGAFTLQAGEERAIEFILGNDVPTGGSIHVRLRISESAVARDLPQMTYILCGGVIPYTDDIGVKRKTGFERIYHIKSQTFCPSADSEREYAN